MIKFSKFTIIVFILVLISLFVIAGVYMQDLTNKQQAEIAKLYAKRDDLITNQQKLEVLMLDLNQTLQKEIVRQKSLSAQLVALTNDKTVLSQLQARLSTPPSSSQVPIAPVTQPTRVVRPVTRAS